MWCQEIKVLLSFTYLGECACVCVCHHCRAELWICVMSSLWEMCVIPACQEIEWVDGILIRAGAKIERQIYGFYIRPWTERDVPYHRHRQTPRTLDSVRISQLRTTQTHTHTHVCAIAAIYQALTTHIRRCRTARFLFIFVRCLHRVVVKGSERYVICWARSIGTGKTVVSYVNV